MQLNRPIAGSARKEPKKTYGFVALDERLFPERISSGLIEAKIVRSDVFVSRCYFRSELAPASLKRAAGARTRQESSIFPERISSGLIEARQSGIEKPGKKIISGAN